MKYEAIHITIDTTGDVHLEVEGAAGMDCLALTSSLETALGQVASREMKPEAYEISQPNPQNLRQRTR